MAIDEQTAAELSNEETHQEIKVCCEVYSRIVGYLRPIQNWNDGKRREFEDRKTFRVPQGDEK